MDFLLENKITTNQLINPFSGFEIKIKREDKIHPIISGNKFMSYHGNDAHCIWITSVSVSFTKTPPLQRVFGTLEGGGA